MSVPELSTPELPRKFTIVIVGNSAVGKTTFLHRWCTGDFLRVPAPTYNLTHTRLRFNTTYGEVAFTILDGPLIGQAFDAIDGAIIMFDVTSQKSYDDTSAWKELLGDSVANVVLCGNKADLSPRVVNANNILNHRKWDVKYFDISAKSNYNFEKPFLTLARMLTGHNDLQLRGHPDVVYYA